MNHLLINNILTRSVLFIMILFEKVIAKDISRDLGLEHWFSKPRSWVQSLKKAIRDAKKSVQS